MSAAASRIESIDVLRGVAVLAMIVANIPSFALVEAARANPTVYGDLESANWWAWLFSYVLVDGRFTAIFGMLFGASIAIVAERAGSRAAALHYRRMTALFGLGLLHAYLVWYGDFLVALAVCGALVFLYHGLPATRLLLIGSASLAMVPLLSIGLSLSLPSWPSDVVVRSQQLWSPSAETIAWEIARYRGGWLEQAAHRVPAAFMKETSQFAASVLWQMTGLMLLGMGLYQLGVLSATRSRRFYVALSLGGFGLGVPLVLAGIHQNFARHWELVDVMAIGGPLNYVGGVGVGLGWIGLVILLFQCGWPMRPFAAIGRLALTNYLAQSLICTTLFYGHGFGLFARVDRAGQLAIALGIWPLLIAFSLWWTARFSVGPVEWLWRSVAYGRWMAIGSR